MRKLCAFLTNHNTDGLHRINVIEIISLQDGDSEPLSLLQV